MFKIECWPTSGGKPPSHPEIIEVEFGVLDLEAFKANYLGRLEVDSFKVGDNVLESSQRNMIK